MMMILVNLLNESQQKDRISTYTQVGTHKDDIDFTMNSIQLKRLAHRDNKNLF